MAYLRTGYRMVADIVDQGEHGVRVGYGEACRFAEDTLHGLAMATLGGAGVALILEKPSLGISIGIISIPLEMGAHINRQVAEAHEEATSMEEGSTLQ